MKKGYKFISNDDSVKVKWNMETTGIHETKDLTFKSFIKIVFSKKYSSNPISWTVFYFYTIKKIFIQCGYIFLA